MEQEGPKPKKSKRWLWIILIVLALLVLVLILLALGKMDEGKTYPETSEAPTLELTWDGTLDPTTVPRFTPYGVWENQIESEEGVLYEPANEMQFYVLTDVENFLAVAPGIVTQNELHGDSGLLTVRYGENYAITYMHIIPDSSLKPGTRIETGDVLGKMEKRQNPTWGEETWWEIQVTKRVDGGTFRTMPPYEYFSDSSQAIFNAISASSKEKHQSWISKEGSHDWTIVDGCSWIKYTKEPSWWNSNRFDFKLGGESEKEFVDSLGLGWVVGDNQSRVIGPTDECQ